MGGGAAAERGEEGLGLGVGVGEEEGEGPGRLVEWGQVGSPTVLEGHFPPPLHTRRGPSQGGIKKGGSAA